jgi:pimeloyl-ACP methyl ester carboxylesterase
MQRRPVGFWADGLRLDAELYLPEPLTPDERRPAVVPLSGYTGLKDIHPARFARALVPHGFACLAFDYRGFGRSQGRAGRLVPQEQVEDARAAVGFLETVAEVDPDRMGLVGWALGGGIAIAEAADDERVKAVVAVNAIGDGERSTRAMHDEASWRNLLARIDEDRRRRATSGASELVSPFEIVRLDAVTRTYVDAELYKTDGYGADVSLESADYLLRFRPELVVGRVAPRPLLLVHGAENRLHFPVESEELYRRAGEPRRLILLEGRGHTEWMLDDDPTFAHVVELIKDFLAEGLAV